MAGFENNDDRVKILKSSVTPIIERLEAGDSLSPDDSRAILIYLREMLQFINELHFQVKNLKEIT